MVGVEINMVVKDSVEALELYEKFFEVERIEVTNFDRGLNEAVFTIYGTRFHLLDENPEYQLVAPMEGDAKSMWVNMVVPDIKLTFNKAIEAGCSEIQPITEMKDFGVSNAIISDKFGYIWLLHQVHREVSFEERIKIFEENMNEHTE